ncbi:MAG: substrate-binding domain-containing protein [Chloroflexota bacterium]|nr:substrate-binding domain-containing protein [Chloroflexota bacterium]
MRHFRNRLALLCLLTLLWSANFSIAQDDNAISIVGSRIMSEVLLSLGEAANIESLSISAQGTSRGIDIFCNGDIDIAVASRAISAAEDLICGANEVVHSEFLFAHKIIAFAAHPAVPLSCISSSDLDSLLKPSSSNQASDWADYAPGTDALPVVILAPHRNTLEYAIADSNIVGDRLRNDVETYDWTDDAVARAGDAEGALAILPFTPDLASDETIKALKTKSAGDSNCVSPSAENLEAGLYPFAQSYFLYVNRARMSDKETLEHFVQVLISPESADTIESFGFTPATPETYDLNARMLSNPDATFAVGAGETAFEIPEALTGAVNISGSANAYQLLERVSSRLSGDSAQLQVSINAVGQAAGLASLCAGEVDLAILDSPPHTLDMTACDASEVDTVSIDIGSHTTVLLGNQADRHTMCLTLEQIDSIWNASSTGAIMAWNDIDAAMPEQTMTLFGLPSVDRYADILLQSLHETAPPIRRDTEQDFDHLYRAAAVGNVEGSLTYMTWLDYQEVLAEQQSNVHLVSVDAGSGCVSPSADTIMNGTYPLSRPASLLASETALTDINVQSLLWSLFSDDNWQLLEREEFLGIERADLPARRRQLETLFRQAESNVAPTEESLEQADDDEAAEDSSE